MQGPEVSRAGMCCWEWTRVKLEQQPAGRRESLPDPGSVPSRSAEPACICVEGGEGKAAIQAEPDLSLNFLLGVR